MKAKYFFGALYLSTLGVVGYEAHLYLNKEPNCLYQSRVMTAKPNPTRQSIENYIIKYHCNENSIPVLRSEELRATLLEVRK